MAKCLELIQDEKYVERSHHENFVDQGPGEIFAQLSQDNTYVEPWRKFVVQCHGQNFTELSDDEMFVELRHDKKFVERTHDEKFVGLSQDEKLQTRVVAKCFRVES